MSSSFLRMKKDPGKPNQPIPKYNPKSTKESDVGTKKYDKSG